jgi:mannose-6-phosphate isomerase
MQVCPLIFEPIFKPKVWGGRNLERLLGKQLPPDIAIGESWECAGLPAGQSIVSRGPAKGRLLGDLVGDWKAELLGSVRAPDDCFPLLIKFLDAQEPLSIQVHPNAEAADALGIETTPKHEAWHVLEARDSGVIYRGLRSGVSVEEAAAAVRKDPASVVDLLHRIQVKAGDSYYIPSGTIHALGAGVVVAEIQTPADTTFRLYDWDRKRPAGDAGIHISEGLQCIRDHQDFRAFEKRSHVTSVFTTVTRLVTCPSFTIERVRFAGGVEQAIPYAELVVWIILDGDGEIFYGRDGRETFRRGEVVLLPAKLDTPRLKTNADCVWLEVTIPVASDLAAFPRPDRAALRSTDSTPNSPIPLSISARRGPSKS